jgi:glucuronoarabinoxylan endo-1,4-beta-xylanase
MKAPMLVRQLFALPALAILLTPAALTQTLTGTVNFTSQLQQIDGFGVAATFGRPTYIQTATGSLPSQIVDLFFNPQTGAGISMLRMGVDDVISSGAKSTSDATGVANSGIFIVNTPPVSCSVTPTYTWDHSAGGEIWIGQQAVKYGVNRFYADSWGAPGYMKTNNNANSGGVICDGTASTQGTGSHCLAAGFSDCRAAYANYMVQYVQDYQADGVPISDLGWINEPNTNTASYASMTPTSAQAINFQDVYGPILRASGLKVNLVCCDVFDWATANTYDTALVNDPTANSYVDIYAAHEYGQVANFVLTTAPTGSPAKKNWMTEWGPASPSAWNPYWDSSFAGTSTNYNDGMFIANDISNALSVGQISAYLYWYADSTSTTGAMLEMGGPYVAGQTYQSWPYFTYTVPARFYALAQFSHFVRPGAHEVTMSTNTPACTRITQGVGSCLATTAFVNPDGSKVINVVNNYTSGAQTLNLALDAGTADWIPTAYVTSVNTIPNSVANSASPEPLTTAIANTSGVASVSGTTLTATFPIRSMTTIVLTPPATSGSVQLVVTPSRFAEGDGTVLSTLTITNNGTGTAQNVQLTSATLGSSVGTTMPTGPLPFAVGNIAPGSSEVVNVNYAAGQTPGSNVIERIAGTYTAASGNGNFGASFRAVVPALPAQP